MQRPTPVYAFALPVVAVEIEAALVVRSVVTPITLAPAVIGGVVLGPAEGSHAAYYVNN